MELGWSMERLRVFRKKLAIVSFSHFIFREGEFLTVERPLVAGVRLFAKDSVVTI
jgi:hypothetical protein